jgi:hypothetical protein
MKVYSRRAAATLLAATLSLSSLSLAAASQEREIGRDKGDRVIRIVKKLQKFFGITTHEDLPTPPKPLTPP